MNTTVSFVNAISGGDLVLSSVNDVNDVMLGRDEGKCELNDMSSCLTE
jgi:predicted Mrr-cat superfamily restriction endonuclease